MSKRSCVSLFILVSSLLLLTIQQTNGYQVNHDSSNSRRNMLQSIAGNTMTAFGVAAIIGTSPSPSYAINACPAKTSNCIRTTWIAPEGSKDVKKSLYTILSEYPQSGQDKVDLGGWSIASGDLLASDNKVRYEYSSGLGNFAKYLNGGTPFIDDLDIEIVNGNTIEIRSSSRIGDSDLDVNKKRLVYLGTKAKALGWTVPDPKY